jgi:hypothetical protein
MNGTIIQISNLIVRRAISTIELSGAMTRTLAHRWFRQVRRNTEFLWRAKLVLGWYGAAILTNACFALVVWYSVGPALYRATGSSVGVYYLTFALTVFSGITAECAALFLTVLMACPRALLEDPTDNSIWPRASFREQAKPGRYMALSLNPVGLLIWLAWRTVKPARKNVGTIAFA